MKTINVAEATSLQLDWLVAKCENSDISIEHFIAMHSHYAYDHGTFDYSTDWSQGGPIIERERISIRQWTNVPIVHAYMPHDDAPWASDGTSPLIAAMRCFVTGKLGDEVDVPEELT